MTNKDDLNEQAMKQGWIKLGEAQRMSPIHIIQEYCNPNRVFLPSADQFTGQYSLPSLSEVMKNLNIYDLGISYVILRSNKDYNEKASCISCNAYKCREDLKQFKEDFERDLLTMTVLCETRERELDTFITYVRNGIDPTKRKSFGCL